MWYNRSMFRKLSRNIFLPIFLISLALILFVDVLSAVMIAKTLKSAFVSVGQSRVVRALDSSELYINSVSASTYNLSQSGILIRELEEDGGASLTSLLDNTCNYSLKMNGVCAYSGISAVPSLEELKGCEGISAFLEGEADSFISFRTAHIADIYANVSYPDKMGVVTCCQRVRGEGGETVGYIFADVLPSNLYDLLLEREQFGEAEVFITFGEEYFDYGGNAAHADLLSGGHSGYFKYEAAADDGLFSLTVFESTAPYSRTLALLIGVLLAVSAVLAVMAFFAAMGTAKSVKKRLDRLAEKMNAQELPSLPPADMGGPSSAEGQTECTDIH